MDQIYFHKKKLIVNTIQFKNIELVGRFSVNIFPSNWDLATNLLFSLNVLKGFQDTGKKGDRK